MLVGKALSVLGVLALLAFAQESAYTSEVPVWPKDISISGSRLVAYQPQVDRWQDYSKIEARLVVKITPKGDSKFVLGALWLEADTHADLETRAVSIEDVRITRANFPGLDQRTSDKMVRLVEDFFSKKFPDVSLDRILANIKRTQESDRSFEGSTKPPHVFVSQKPAVLVLIDGKPVLSPIENTGVKFVVNTNWDLLRDGTSNQFFLLDGQTWLTAPHIDGPWTNATWLPASFSTIPDTEDWKEVRAHLSIMDDDQTETPHVFVSTKPAELIVNDGPPKMEAVEGTGLSYITNTRSDVFFFSGDSHYYYLVSGRWFKAKSLDGTWISVGKDLPGEFTKIPPNGPRGDVLASIPGTPQAEEAVIQSRIPQKAVVKRDQAKLDVPYAGKPVFDGIKGTSLKYAVNTPVDVVLAGGRYYACYKGIWFVSDSPTGPWEVCDSVPDEIYTIPPSSPVYNTTYVHVYDSTPTEIVVGYTPGYLGCYEDNGSVVYGTGYYYPPYIWPEAIPIYFPRLFTYGMAAYYNPFTGSFWRAGALYGPYGGIGRAAMYNPANGAYVRGAAAWGPYRGTWAAEAYNPTTGTRLATHQSRNVYAQWGRSAVSRGGQYARAGHYSGPRLSAAGTQTSRGTTAVEIKGKEHSAGAVRTPSGDLYVGKDGNIYKHTDDGWSKYNAGRKWQSMEGLQSRIRTADGLVSQKGLRSNLQEWRSRFGDARSNLPEPRSIRERATRYGVPGAEGIRQRIRTAQRDRVPGQAMRESLQQDLPLRNEVLRGLQSDFRARYRGQIRAGNFRAWQRTIASMGSAAGPFPGAFRGARGFYGGGRGMRAPRGFGGGRGGFRRR